MQNVNHKIAIIAFTLLGMTFTKAVLSQSATPERLHEITLRGMQVMPFDLRQTQHLFIKTGMGGIQQVIVRDAANSNQIDLIRQHLSKIATEFSQGDFSNPEKIHGKGMPGLAILRTAKPDQLHVQYKELYNGAEIRYSTEDNDLINAIYQWFNAQLADHASDATSDMDHDNMHSNHAMHNN